MLNGAAKYHKKAAEHHESAAHHHKEAAKYYEDGAHEKAAYHARLVRSHYIQATHHVSQDASQREDATVEVKAMKNDRGSAKCRSCNLRFLKTQVTSQGQCLGLYESL
jgi:hypothetical protein